ncbi:UPF0014 hypothetical protein [Helicosporidium sp. ATCC 50920]|nr:UPF0014 hypothetical protein [Helicosporidium sp. ATCC 50920]|eukprot:KDD75208.1 UPF0014 hypothetical protein [Helicosporidium sp. ATCC 50920]
MEHGDDDSAGGVVPISVAQMVLAIAALALDGSISAWLRLGMHWQLAVAAARVVLQLTALGWALSPIFLRDSPPLTAAYLTLALFLAAAESVSRSRQVYRSMFAHALVALAAPCVLLLLYACFVVVRPRPWWTARTAVPVMGMLLGNACSAVALALDSLLDSLKNKSDRVEALVALGATRWEASREALRAAVRASMTPTINQMNVAGIVAIPGLMTGQILGGGDPAMAARYQIVLLALLAVATGSAGAIAAHLAVAATLDGQHRLRKDRLRDRAEGKGALNWIWGELVTVGLGTRGAALGLWQRLRLAFGRQGKARRAGRARGEAADAADLGREPLLEVGSPRGEGTPRRRQD